MSAPTRLPYGLSYVKPGARSGEYTFTAGDQTPDVSLGTTFFNAASALTITNFDGGERGKIIYLRCNTGGAITLQNSAGGIRLSNIVVTGSAAGYVLLTASGGNTVMLNGETLGFLHNGTDWSNIGTRVVLDGVISV